MSEVRPIVTYVSALVKCGEHVLLVQEAKEVNYGKWNLPGGHLEVGESLLSGIQRECREETLLDPEIVGLVGIYSGLTSTGLHAIRFVFAGKEIYPDHAKAGDEILDVRWFEWGEARLLADKDLVEPAKFREILAHLTYALPTPLDILKESLP